MPSSCWRSETREIIAAETTKVAASKKNAEAVGCDRIGPANGTHVGMCRTASRNTPNKAAAIGIAGAFLCCLLVGAINGWLIAYLGVNPFVATLGTMTVVRGLIYVATNASPRFPLRGRRCFA